MSVVVHLVGQGAFVCVVLCTPLVVTSYEGLTKQVVSIIGAFRLSSTTLFRIYDLCP